MLSDEGFENLARTLRWKSRMGSAGSRVRSQRDRSLHYAHHIPVVIEVSALHILVDRNHHAILKKHNMSQGA